MALKPSFKSRYIGIALICTVITIQFAGAASPPSAAQSGERVIDNRIPTHIPIKVQIKKEKEQKVKDLSNLDWIRDIEIEVTNTSDKPIYFLRFHVVLPEIKPAGVQMGFPLNYGRIDFEKNFNERPTVDDVSIKPKDTIIFVISDLDQKGWFALKQKDMVSEPTKMELVFAHLSYGDGTGFTTTGGVSYPFKRHP